MEFKIRGENVLLTTHKTYCEVGEQNGLQAVSLYSPFLKFSTECEKRGPVPRAFIIRNIFRFAHRVVGILMDVEYVDSTGVKVTHTVHLTDQSPAVLLPVIHVGEKAYALLIRHRRIATSMKLVTEAITGMVGPNGEFSCKEHERALEKVGVQLSSSQLISERTFTIGGDEEGALGYHFYTMRMARTTEELAPLLVSSGGSKTTIDQGSSGSTSVLEPRLYAVPISEVNECGDAKATLATCLISLFSGRELGDTPASISKEVPNPPTVEKVKANMFHNVELSGALSHSFLEEKKESMLHSQSQNISSTIPEVSSLQGPGKEEKPVEEKIPTNVSEMRSDEIPPSPDTENRSNGFTVSPNAISEKPENHIVIEGMNPASEAGARATTDGGPLRSSQFIDDLPAPKGANQALQEQADQQRIWEEEQKKDQWNSHAPEGYALPSGDADDNLLPYHSEGIRNAHLEEEVHDEVTDTRVSESEYRETDEGSLPFDEEADGIHYNYQEGGVEWEESLEEGTEEEEEEEEEEYEEY